MAALMAVLVAGLVGSAVAQAARDEVGVAATFNGQDVAAASTARPVRMEPGTLSKIVLDVTNRGKEPVVVKRVELAGDILGLNFFRYVASTELTVQPGTTGTLSYQLDLTDLEHQATGLIRGEMKVTDDAGRVIATIPTVTDVRGSLWSLSGLFALFLIVFTALALVIVAVAVARHRLPANRAQRGLRFLLPGIGLILVLGFTASVLRLWTPTTGVWLAAAGICAIVFFGLGYFSPMPGDEDDDDYFTDGDYDQYAEGVGLDQNTDDFANNRNTDDFADDQNTSDYTDDQRTRLNGPSDDRTTGGYDALAAGSAGQRAPNDTGT